MNLGQAVAVVLYEMRRTGWEPPLPPQPAPAQELETLLTSLAAAGQAMDYPAGHAPAVRLGRIRRAFQDAVLPPATVRFLLSFVRRLHKIGASLEDA
jgi:tRNA C32,U32 (ribose-2'-O)-methylase TrmJ